MYYETIFIVNPDVSQENTEQLTDELVERVEKASGRIVKREYWGARPLSYSIQKRKRGHYILLVTDGEPQAVQALESAIRLEERILRFLTTRLTELSDAPSPLARRKTVAVESTEETKADETAAESTDASKETATEETATESTDATEKSDTAEAKTEEKPAETEAKVETKVEAETTTSTEDTTAS
ncbi:MAG: 30S ribosomal protein S6 [Mariprofundaceae bacterium]|nr:30S ribosomal protein S6 [Mariprofundaceae bacterium]